MFVCTGTVAHIDTSTERFLRIEPQLPGKTRRTCGNEFGAPQLQYKVQETLIAGQRQHVFGQSIVSLPRHNYPQHVEVLWNSKSEPGVVYAPQNGTETIITAGYTFPDAVESITVEPASISDFGSYLQQTFLASIAGLGWPGLVILAGVVLIFITAPVWFIDIMRALFRKGSQRRESGHKA